MGSDFEQHTRDFYRQYFQQWEYFGDERSRFAVHNPDFGGPFGRPDTRVHVGKRAGERILFEVDYSFDALGRRGPLPAGAAGEYLVLAGGTQVFGEGVEDEETIGAWLQRLSPGTHAYNYGFLGHGPQNFLHKCERGFAPGEIRERRGSVFCFYRDDSVSISVGKRPWARHHPYYSLGADGALRLQGDFAQGGAPPCPDVHLPSDCVEADFRVTAAIYARTAEILRRTLPDCRFTVVIEPVTFTAARMAEALAGEGVEILDLAGVDLDFLAWPESRFVDTNLTSDGNRVLASWLHRSISEPGVIERLARRRSRIDALTAVADPDRAAFFGGFLFNYYAIFPMDDALDLALRCAHGSHDDALKHHLVERCRAGFDLKRRLVDQLREGGILDAGLRPRRTPTLDQLRQLLPPDVPVAAEMLELFLETCFQDQPPRPGQ